MWFDIAKPSEELVAAVIGALVGIAGTLLAQFFAGIGARVERKRQLRAPWVREVLLELEKEVTGSANELGQPVLVPEPPFDLEMFDRRPTRFMRAYFIVRMETYRSRKRFAEQLLDAEGSGSRRAVRAEIRAQRFGRAMANKYRSWGLYSVRRSFLWRWAHPTILPSDFRIERFHWRSAREVRRSERRQGIPKRPRSGVRYLSPRSYSQGPKRWWQIWRS